MEVLYAAILCGVAAVLYGVVTRSSILSSSAGTDNMQGVSPGIQVEVGNTAGEGRRLWVEVVVVVGFRRRKGRKIRGLVHQEHGGIWLR